MRFGEKRKRNGYGRSLDNKNIHTDMTTEILAIATLLSPWVVSWYYILRKRYLNYLKLLMGGIKHRNIGEVVREYKELLERNRG